MESLCEINVRSLLPTVSVPTLYFSVMRPNRASGRRSSTAAEIPNARFVPLASSNHILLADERAWKIFVQELGAFLDGKTLRIPH